MALPAPTSLATASSPGALTGTISRWSAGQAIAEPCTHFSRSAWKRRMPNAEAIASVTPPEPIGIVTSPTSMPPA